MLFQVRWVLLLNPTAMASALCPCLLWSEQKFSSTPLGSPNCSWETETNASNPSAVTRWIFHFSPTIMLLLWRFPLPSQRNNGNSRKEALNFKPLKALNFKPLRFKNKNTKVKYSLFFLQLYMQLAFFPKASDKARRQIIYQKTIGL